MQSVSDLKNAKTLSEAIRQLEDVGHKTIDDMKPFLDDLKSKVETQVGESKTDIENKIAKNPWATLIAVGLFAFIIGCFFGRQQNKKDDTK